MNGLMANCNTYVNCKEVDQYISRNNPYEIHPSIGMDLVALTKYAKKCKKLPKQLSETEISKFKKVKS